MDSARPASSQVSKIRSMSKASSSLVGGLVQELICESRTKRERKGKSGSTGNWSHGAPTSCGATGTIQKTLLSHVETEWFARETSAIMILTDNAISVIACNT